MIKNKYENLYVITVSYNMLDELVDTVQNVESYGIKHIVIDGNSQDGTKDFLNNNKKIYKSISEEDSGIYDAMNKGWNLVPENAFVLFLGAGDKILNLPLIISSGDVFFGDVCVGDDLFKSKVSFRTKISNTIHHQGMFIRKREPFLNSPFDLSFKVYSDYDFNLRMIKSNFSFIYDPDIKSFAKPGGISSQFNYKENCAVIKKNYGLVFAILANLYIKMRRWIK